MKKIYKIPKGQNVATSEGWKHIDTEIKDFVYETEQIPETFDDLLTLCKETKGCFILETTDSKYIEVPTDLIGYSFTFYKDGTIFFDTDICIKEKVTFQQMWEIIKNLVI